MTVQLLEGDCLGLMPDIPDNSIDMILCDLPYGTTACKWDTIIPFEPLWNEYNRIAKDTTPIVLFGSEPFSSALRFSNIKNYKYDWYWRKTNAKGHLNAKKQPMRKYETISIFYKKQCYYNPQDLIKGAFNNSRPSRDTKEIGKHVNGIEKQFGVSHYTNYPTNELNFSNPNNNTQHPTQKPVKLFEYLIKTYTNENDLVLDNCAGSGTTGVACHNLNRNAILIEKEPEYCTIIKQRLQDTTNQSKLI